MSNSKIHQEKPVYSVLSMDEIARVPSNGYTVVSTFSGAGGSCLGFRMAGFKVLWASEFIPAAQEVYRLNHPDTILDTRDIRNVQPEEILESIGMKCGEVDVMEGSPPCASFSTAGKREAGWGKVKPYSDTKQRVDDLFFEFSRIVKGIQPKVFVAENVSGLVKGKAKGYFIEILNILKDCGYNVRAKLLDAQWLGVPQMRQRIIFVGVRKDLGIEPAFPKPLSYRYSVREALPWIDSIEGANGFNGHAFQGGNLPASTVQQSRPVNCRAYLDKRGSFGNDLDITEQPASTVLSDSVGTHWIVQGEPTVDIDAVSQNSLTHGRMHTHSERSLPVNYVEPESNMSGFAVGQEWDTLDQGETSDKYIQLSKPNLDNPCPTVTQRGGDNTAASVTHPLEKRKFSIVELKRICAFPDDFILTGTYAQQWERLGRSVPPVMMFHIARTVQTEILDRCKS